MVQAEEDVTKRREYLVCDDRLPDLTDEKKREILARLTPEQRRELERLFGPWADA